MVAHPAQVIELVVYRLISTLRLGEGQSLIVDYQGHPVQYTAAGMHAGVPMTGLAPLGEADVKFVRYATMFEKLQVDSIDGDSVPIALLHMERTGGMQGNISVLRLETRLKGSSSTADKGAKRARTGPSRVYEYVNIGLLFAVLRDHVIPQCLGRTPMPMHRGHEIAMLVSLIGLSGTDFTRGIPLVSGKTIYELLPNLWLRLAVAYNTETRQLDPDVALNTVLATIYQRKFERHTKLTGNNIDSVLEALQASSLSEKTRSLIPSKAVLHCTVRNTNWLLHYWLDEAYPDPVQPQFGFVRAAGAGSAVRYEIE